MDFKNSMEPQDFDPEVFESFAEAILDDVDAYLRDEYCRLVEAERLMLNPVFYRGPLA